MMTGLLPDVEPTRLPTPQDPMRFCRFGSWGDPAATPLDRCRMPRPQPARQIDSAARLCRTPRGDQLPVADVGSCGGMDQCDLSGGCQLWGTHGLFAVSRPEPLLEQPSESPACAARFAMTESIVMHVTPSAGPMREGTRPSGLIGWPRKLNCPVRISAVAATWRR